MLAGEKRSKIGRITAGKIRRMVDRGSGKADELAKAGIERPGTQQGPRQDGPHPGAGTMMRQAMGAQKRPETDAPFGKTIKDARGAVDKLKQGGHDVILGNQIADMMRIKNKGPKWNQGTLDNDDGEKQNKMWQKLTRLPAISKDAEAVKQMNIEARDLVQDPDYKMDQYDDEEYGDDYLSEGAFGQVFQDRNGNIVKKGGLGPSELKALFAMKDNPAFPNLINAQFDEPFIHKSSVENNSRGRRTNERATGVEEYWEPDDQSEWDKQFPTAQGTYAMSPAKGEELFSGIDELDDDMKDKVMRNFWKARGDLHKAGFSHNDMHGGNIFMDPETGEVNIIDLGLAKENKLSALMEGLGGLDFEEGQDYQLNHHMGGSNFSERMQEVSVNNRANIEQEIMDNLDIDMDDEDNMEASMEAIRQMMTGDIRMRDDDFDNIKEAIPYLADDENVGKLIKMLYDGIGNSELADRMGDAFEKKQLDTKVLKAANLMRKQKGQSQIEPKKSVIPPENMDFDD